jgi:hypothetical protein
MNEKDIIEIESSSQSRNEIDIQIQKQLNRSNLKRAIAIVILILSIPGLGYLVFWTILGFGCIGPGAGIGFVFADGVILYIDYCMIKVLQNEKKKIRDIISSLTQ